MKEDEEKSIEPSDTSSDPVPPGSPVKIIIANSVSGSIDCSKEVSQNKNENSIQTFSETEESHSLESSSYDMERNSTEEKEIGHLSPIL